MRVIHHGETEDGRRFTVAGVYEKTTSEVKFGVAICGPRDQFARKVGRAIAEGRAKKHPTLVKELKVQLSEDKQGYAELSKLGYEVVDTIRKDPFSYQIILTEQYKTHKKTK